MIFSSVVGVPEFIFPQFRVLDESRSTGPIIDGGEGIDENRLSN